MRCTETSSIFYRYIRGYTFFLGARINDSNFFFFLAYSIFRRRKKNSRVNDYFVICSSTKSKLLLLLPTTHAIVQLRAMVFVSLSRENRKFAKIRYIPYAKYANKSKRRNSPNAQIL